MIREKISSKSPNNRQQQQSNTPNNGGVNLNQLKMSGDKTIIAQSRNNYNTNDNGIVRIEKSLKRVDSLQSVTHTPTNIKKIDLFKSVSNSSKDNNDSSENNRIQTKNISSQFSQNSSIQSTGQNPVITQQQQINSKGIHQLKDIDLNTVQNKKNFKLSVIPQAGVITQSFITGDSMRNQNLREGTDRSNKSQSMMGISVSIINKEYTFLNDFVNGEDWRKITKLELCQNKLQIFPNEIWDLVELRSIRLDNNCIKSIPDWAFERLPELKDFSIQNNLVKAIPTTISKAISLSSLDFSLNHVDTLPNELFDLPNLAYLGLTSNDFDSIPASFIKLENTLKEIAIDWFRYANPPMNIRQGEPAIKSLIAAMIKDLNNQQYSKSQIDNPKTMNLNKDSNNSQYNQQFAKSSSFKSFNQGSSSTNFTSGYGDGSSLQNLNIDYTKHSYSFLKFVRIFSKVFDLSRVVSPESGGTLAHQAVYNEDIGALISLLNYDLPQFVNPLDKHMHSPLSLAIREEQYYCAKILIYRGADPNIGSGISGSSCLLISVSKLQYYLVKDLIERGANVNHVDKEKNSCMHALFKVFDNNPKEGIKIGNLLLDNGANPNLINSGKWSPLHVAARKGNIHAIQFALHYNKKYKKDSERSAKSPVDINSNEAAQCFNIHQQNNQSNGSPKDQKNVHRVLFKIYQRGGEEKMNILHISSQSCFTDIVELLILQENYNFTKRNGYDRNAYSLSQRHSTISKLLKRSEVRMLDCFINQDLIKVLESKMYDCQDDDLAQINPYQKSKAYNFYDQINQNNRLSALNSSFQNQRVNTDDRMSSFNYTQTDLMTQTPNNQTKRSQPSQLSMFSFLKQGNQNQPYFGSETKSSNNPYILGNVKDTLTFGLSASKNNTEKEGYINFPSSQTSKDSLITQDFNLNSPNFYKEQNPSSQITQNMNIPLDLTRIKKADSFHFSKDSNNGNPSIQSSQNNMNSQYYLSESQGEGQHYLGSFLIQNSLQAFRKSREDFQKLQNKLYPYHPLTQNNQNRNVNILDSFSNDNLNSESVLNASDELTTINNKSTKTKWNQSERELSKYSQQKLFHSEQTLQQKSQNNTQFSQISTNQTNNQLPINQPQSSLLQNLQPTTNQEQQRKGFETEDQDSVVDLISEESGVKSSQIFSWSKLQPKLIQDKLEEEKKNDAVQGNKRQIEEFDSMEESSMKQQIGNNNPKIFSKAQIYNSHIRSNFPRSSKLGEIAMEAERIREILEFSIDESNSSEEQNIDELQENIEESLNESFTRRIMPYSPNNLKHIHPSFRSQNLNNGNNLDNNFMSQSKYSLPITTTPQPIKIKKNYVDNLQNVFKSNLSTIYNSNKMYESQSMPQGYDEDEQTNDVACSISLNEQSWNKHCYKMKTQKRVDQLLEQLKYLELKLKNQDLILQRRLDSLNNIKEIETSLKSILKELISNRNFKEANQFDMISIQQYISSAITQFNLTINQIYLYFFNLMQQSKLQVDYFKSITNAPVNEIKLEKDWDCMQRHFALERIHDNKVVNILFQQLFPQNNVVSLRQQLGYMIYQNQPIIQTQNPSINSTTSSFISNSKFNSTPTSSQITNSSSPRIQLNQQYDQIQMSTNPLFYFESVQRMQQHMLNPQSRTHILNETQLMQTLPTEEEYDTHQIEQPSIKFTQYNSQKPKGSALHKRPSVPKQTQ